MNPFQTLKVFLLFILTSYFDPYENSLFKQIMDYLVCNQP